MADFEDSGLGRLINFRFVEAMDEILRSLDKEGRAMISMMIRDIDSEKKDTDNDSGISRSDDDGGLGGLLGMAIALANKNLPTKRP